MINLLFFLIPFLKAKSNQNLIRETAKKLQLNVPTMLAIAEQESNFDNSLTGGVGEVGIMQMRPDALIDVNRNFDLNLSFNEIKKSRSLNIYAGQLFFKLLLGQTGNENDAIRAYNAGLTGSRLGRSFEYLESVKRKRVKYANN